MKKVLCLLPLMALGACNVSQLTPTQTAALFCIIDQTGVTLLTGFATSTAAQTRANQLGNAGVALCNSAGQVAAIVTPAPVSAK